MAQKICASALEIYINNYQIRSLGYFTQFSDSCRVASRLSLAFVAHSSSEFGQCARQGHKKHAVRKSFWVEGEGEQQETGPHSRCFTVAVQL